MFDNFRFISSIVLVLELYLGFKRFRQHQNWKYSTFFEHSMYVCVCLFRHLFISTIVSSSLNFIRHDSDDVIYFQLWSQARFFFFFCPIFIALLEKLLVLWHFCRQQKKNTVIGTGNSVTELKKFWQKWIICVNWCFQVGKNCVDLGIVNQIQMKA